MVDNKKEVPDSSPWIQPPHSDPAEGPNPDPYFEDPYYPDPYA
jgi:hypothetical protein